VDAASLGTPMLAHGMSVGTGIVIEVILAGGPLTGASLNPARTFGPALVGG